MLTADDRGIWASAAKRAALTATPCDWASTCRIASARSTAGEGDALDHRAAAIPEGEFSFMRPFLQTYSTPKQTYQYRSTDCQQVGTFVEVLTMTFRTLSVVDHGGRTARNASKD
jgi:hypothetical protein